MMKQFLFDVPRFYGLTAKFIVGLLILAAVAGCSGGTPAAEIEPIENISAPTPTPKPTATPIVRATVAPAGDEAAVGEDNGEGSGLLSGFMNSQEATATPAAGNEEMAGSVPAPEISPPGLDPVELTIDLKSGDLNTWVEIAPPPGWRITQGLDGIVLAKEPETIPDNAFIMVRRWGNVVNLEDYIAYLPDALEEQNSNVAFKLGGYDWEGVFLTNETNSYRAFFGVSNDVLPSFSLLVFVPGPNPLPGEEAITRETLLEVWTFDVGDLNSILRRLSFY